MKRPVDLLLGALLWLNALAFLVGLLAGWSFDEWILIDVVAVIVCALTGFLKRIRILQLIAGIIIVGALLRFATPVWLLIDILVIGSCLYVGYLFLKGEVERIQYHAG
jgi:hypothetical protein